MFFPVSNDAEWKGFGNLRGVSVSSYVSSSSRKCHLQIRPSSAGGKNEGRKGGRKRRAKRADEGRERKERKERRKEGESIK